MYQEIAAWKMIGTGMAGGLQAVTRMPESASEIVLQMFARNRALQDLPVLPGLMSQSLLKTEELTLVLSVSIS